MLEYLVLIGALVNIIGMFPYIHGIILEKNRPNKISWLMWTISPMIATAAALSKGAGLIVLPVFITGLVSFPVLAFSFMNPKSHWELKWFDYLCGSFSVVALLLWIITKNPGLAVLFAIAGDFTAAIPTLIKSWKYPETESVNIYAASLFNSLTGFFAIQTYSFSEAGFLIYLNIINTLLILAIILPEHLRKKQTILKKDTL